MTHFPSSLPLSAVVHRIREISISVKENSVDKRIKEKHGGEEEEEEEEKVRDNPGETISERYWLPMTGFVPAFDTVL